MKEGRGDLTGDAQTRPTRGCGDAEGGACVCEESMERRRRAVDRARKG